MLCEQNLNGDEVFYHQDANGWLAWRQEQEKMIRNEYLRRLEHNESTQDFFWRLV